MEVGAAEMDSTAWLKKTVESFDEILGAGFVSATSAGRSNWRGRVEARWCGPVGAKEQPAGGCVGEQKFRQ